MTPGTIHAVRSRNRIVERKGKFLGFCRPLPVLAAISLGALAIFGSTSLGQASQSASQPGPTLRIRAGWGTGGPSVNQFFGDTALAPTGDRVRVAVGTTVVWYLGSDEFHTVTFAAGAPTPKYFVYQPEGADRPPMINPQLAFPTVPTGAWDGTTFVHMEMQQPGQELPITFGREGTFSYLCLFHPPMTGVVEVVAAGSAGLTTQAAVDQYTQSHPTAVHQPQIDQMLASRSAPVRIEGASGTNTWFVRAGTDWRNGHLDMLAFLPKELTVRQGDTVVWYVDHLMPHTVTFPAAGEPPADFILVQFADGTIVTPPPPGEPPSAELMAKMMDPSSEPRLVFGPAGLRNVPSPTYDGQRLYNSGLIGEHPAVEPAMDKVWALTFNTPGTFRYLCVLHEPAGMEGTITVTAR